MKGVSFNHVQLIHIYFFVTIDHRNLNIEVEMVTEPYLCLMSAGFKTHSCSLLILTARKRWLTSYSVFLKGWKWNSCSHTSIIRHFLCVQVLQLYTLLLNELIILTSRLAILKGTGSDLSTLSRSPNSGKVPALIPAVVRKKSCKFIGDIEIALCYSNETCLVRR